ncbi:MAG: aminotransferase class V-fold PLP-dependent enzyme [candidate division Zixibacteria bacterium]
MKKLDFRAIVVGTQTSVPVLGGGKKRYINFDNAASTPALKPVVRSLNKFMEYYSSVHRGTGYKSVVSTRVYDQAHLDSLRFVGADRKYFTSIFMKNTTDAINKLARRLDFKKGDIVLSSMMEHHSNDLPWRVRARTEHIEIDDTGHLDLDDLKKKLKQYRGKVKLVAITAASNVTGLIPPIHDIARLAHSAGASILVDAAQLVAHRKVRMGPPGEPESIDYLVYSAHKMYAPFGIGVLIGPKSIFKKGDPDSVGGGTVNYVTTSDVQWAHLPDKEEAGSPNVPGAVALSAAIEFLESARFSKIAAHEKELTKYALKRLSAYDEIKLYGPSKWIAGEDRVGVVAFNIDGFYHAIVAAILSFEGAIAVRNGCFCAHPYIQRLLGISDEKAIRYRDAINRGIRLDVPGMIRVSFGIYNTKSEIDRFMKLIDMIIRGEYKGKYTVDCKSGEAYPAGYRFKNEIRF